MAYPLNVGEVITRLAERFGKDFGLTPVMATEIEFYLHGIEELSTAGVVIQEVMSACEEVGIAILEMEHERGFEQFEISLEPTHHLAKLAEDTERAREVIAQVAKQHGVEADFSAKPDVHQPGSGLHVHLHLEDKRGRNVFARDEEGVYSEPLLHAIGGMLALMRESMAIFAPRDESYLRYVEGGTAPVTVSWGPNNRTVAIRLPQKGLDDKHIEHRVAGADADIAMVMLAVLAGAHYGLVTGAEAGEPIHGDAGHAQYGAVALPKSRAEAEQLMRESERLKGYLGD